MTPDTNTVCLLGLGIMILFPLLGMIINDYERKQEKKQDYELRPY